MIPIASICGWTSPYGFNPWSILAYMGMFIVIYLIIWTAIYLYWKNWVKRANDKLA
jgi:Ni,Fe-hydrogenase I cytochrome b subunit